MPYKWGSPFDDTVESPEAESTWTDLGKEVLAGVNATAGQLAGAVEAIPPLTGEYDPDSYTTQARQHFERAAAGIRETTTPGHQRVMQADILGGGEGEDITDVGLMDWLMGQTAANAASIVASIVPAGLVARGALAAGASTSRAALAGTVTSRAAEGVLNAGSVANEISAEIERMSDDELREASPYYADLLDTMPSDQAREQIRREVVGFAPLVAGLASTVFGGAEAIAARKLAGEGITGGLSKRIAKGIASEAGEEAYQSGVGSAAVQAVLANAGIRDEMDWVSVIEDVIGGAISGAPLGGLVGAVSKDKGHEVVAVDASDIDVEEDGAIDFDEDEEALDLTSTQPPPAATVGPGSIPATPAAARPQPSQRPRAVPSSDATTAATQQPVEPQAPLPPKPEQPAPQAGPGPAAPPVATLPSVINTQTLHGMFTDAAGFLDAGAASDYVASEADSALSQGKEVIYWNEDKPIKITSVNNGMLTDEVGQSWGIMGLLAPHPQRRTEIEISGRVPIGDPQNKSVRSSRKGKKGARAPSAIVSDTEVELPSVRDAAPAIAAAPAATQVQTVEVAGPDATHAAALAQSIPQPVTSQVTETPAPILPPTAAPLAAAVEPATSPAPPVLAPTPPIPPEPMVEQGLLPIPTPGIGPRGRRVLAAAVSPEQQALIDEAQAAEDERIGRNIEQLNAPPPVEVVRSPETYKSKDNKKLQLRERRRERAEQLFNERLPETPEDTSSAEGRVALRDRLQGIVDDFRSGGLSLPGTVDDTSYDHVVWVREAADIAKLLSKRAVKAKDIAEQKRRASAFISRELAARGGDFSVMREGRKVEGEASKRVSQGDVEKRASGRGTTIEEDIAAAEAEVEAGEEGEALDRAVPEEGDEVGIAEFDAAIEADEDAEPAEDADDETAPSPVFASVDAKAPLKPEAVLKPEEIERMTKAPKGAAVVQKIKTRKKVEVTPKVAELRAKAEERVRKPVTLKARLKAAEAKTDKSPTEGERAAGNFEKGKLRAHGLTITIETPKGAMRTNKPGDPNTWSVKMPASYGYINRTSGADGDSIDVYIGPNPEADTVFVIDQRNPDTLEFDEHKVLFGFNNALQAQDAYEDSFSDGRAKERVADIRVMKIDQLKEWLKTAKGKRRAGIDTTAEAIKTDIEATPPVTEVASAAMAARGRGFSSPVGASIDQTIADYRSKGEQLKGYLESIKINSGPLDGWLDAAQSLLEGMDQNRRAVNTRTIPYTTVIKKLKPLVENTNLYIVDSKKFAKLFPKQSEALAIYNLASDTVVLNGEKFDQYPTEEQQNTQLAHTIVHEAVHAAFMKATYESPIIRQQLNRLFEQARAMNFFGTEHYGLTDIDELIAEGLSNPDFQAYLDGIQVSADLATELKLGRTTTLWDTFVGIVRKALGLGSVPNSALEALMKISGRLELGAIALNDDPASDAALREYITRPGPLEAALMPVQETRELAAAAAGPRLMRIRTFDQLAQVSKAFFKGVRNPVRRVADAVERTRVRAGDLLKQTEPFILRLHNAERKYSGDVWEGFTAFLNDVTMSGVDPSKSLASQKKHLGTKNSLKGVWQREQYDDLSNRYNRLPAELQKLYHEGLKFFRDRQDAMSLQLVGNVLRALGKYDENVAQRLYAGKATDDDKAFIGEDNYDHVARAARSMRVLAGPYFPLMRRGQFVTRGTYKIKPPSDAVRKLDDRTWEFDNKASAMAFAKRQPNRATATSIYLHKATNEAWVTEPTTGKRVRISKQDADAVRRFRVTVQDQHMEMFDNENDARAAQAWMEKSDLFVPNSVLAAQPVKDVEREGGGTALMSVQFQALAKHLQRREGFQQLSKESQEMMFATLNEMSIRVLASTRIQSKRMPRRYVQGASRNFTRNSHDYAISTSNYLARLENQLDLDQALKDMETAVDKEDKVTASARRKIAEEVKYRVSKAYGYEQQGALAEWSNRAATLAYIKFLASPAYSALQALQPGMLTLPNLAARHGVGTAARAMFDAYNQVNAWSVTKQGLKATAAKAVNDQTDSNFLSDVLSRIGDKGVRDMLQRLRDMGSISGDAGFEVGTLIRADPNTPGGRLDKGLYWAQNVATQLPRSVETINRTATAIAAYNLELQRTKSAKMPDGDHELAVLYAQEVTNLTQGLYSFTDAPPIFNTPLGRITLQFKKYGQLIYGLFGHQIGKAIRNTNKGDRAEAIKSIAFTLGTHVALAGVMGLPTEPVKWAVTVANATGVTELTWQDVENAQRRVFAMYMGQTIGEIASRGLPRVIGIDLSGRVGLSDVTTFSEPRSDDVHDIKAYLWDLVAGATGSMIGDTLSGANDFMSGDLMKAVEKIAPAKIVGDTLRAVNRGTVGKRTEAGYQAMEPYNIAQGLLRAFGITSAREAESQEQRAFFRHATTVEANERQSWQRQWAMASPSQRMRLWGQVEDWNRGRPKSMRLTRDELEKYRKRRESEIDRGVVQQGFRVDRRNRPLYEETLRTYNP